MWCQRLVIAGALCYSFNKAVGVTSRSHQEKGRSMLVSRKQLGLAVQAARAKAGLTQAQLSERAGLDQTRLNAIEQGEEKPASAELSRLAEALNIDELELLRRPSPGYLII
jgi:ribosome-binding protein aMBF1 (putative translation factor)